MMQSEHSLKKSYKKNSTWYIKICLIEEWVDHTLSFLFLLLLYQLIDILNQRFQDFPALGVQCYALFCWQPFTILLEIFSEIDVYIAFKYSNWKPFIFGERPILFAILVDLFLRLGFRLIIEIFLIFLLLLMLLLFLFFFQLHCHWFILTHAYLLKLYIDYYNWSNKYWLLKYL